MVVFGGIEFFKRCNFSDHRLVEYIFGIQFYFVFFGNFLLFRRMIKNYRTVLCSHIGSLTVECGWVVSLPKNFEQFAKADRLWIKSDLNDFGMACGTRAYFFVGRIFNFSARIARINGYNTFQTFKYGFGTPKASVAESCCFFLS